MHVFNKAVAEEGTTPKAEVGGAELHAIADMREKEGAFVYGIIYFNSNCLWAKEDARVTTLIMMP